MSAPKISVIAPVFNVETYLELFLESLLDQTEQSIEIITVNDGSTDGSEKILQNFAAKDDRVILVKKQNGGLPAARNYGLKYATGKWIYFADSDDWLAPTALETWLKQAETDNLDFLLGNGFRFHHNPIDELTDDSCLIEQLPWNNVISGKEWLIQFVTSTNFKNAAWLKFVSAAFIKNNNIEFIEGIVNEDILWTLSLVNHAQRVSFCPSPFYGYRHNPNSITGSIQQAAFIHRAESYLIVFENLAELIKENRQSEFRSALSRLLIREMNPFMVVIHKRITSSVAKYRLIRKFISLKIMNSTLYGIKSYHELGQVIYYGILISRIMTLGITSAYGKTQPRTNNA